MTVPQFHIRPHTRDAAVTRARHMIGAGHYVLGAGASVDAETPFDAAGNPHPGGCDCSGFTAWCTGIARRQRLANGAVVELNTDGVLADAGKAQHFYRMVKRAEPVLPGDLIVYGWTYGDFDHDGDTEGRPGHIGIICAVHDDFVRRGPGWWEALEIIHCTPRKQATLGAIKHSDASLWASHGTIVRPLHYVGA